MKYTSECLDKAVLIVLPTSNLWLLQLPTKLDMAAKEIFMRPNHGCLDFDRGLAELVIRAALIDLSTVGWFVFGDFDCWVN